MNRLCADGEFLVDTMHGRSVTGRGRLHFRITYNVGQPGQCLHKDRIQVGGHRYRGTGFALERRAFGIRIPALLTDDHIQCSIRLYLYRRSDGTTPRTAIAADLKSHFSLVCTGTWNRNGVRNSQVILAACPQCKGHQDHKQTIHPFSHFHVSCPFHNM